MRERRGATAFTSCPYHECAEFHRPVLSCRLASILGGLAMGSALCACQRERPIPRPFLSFLRVYRGSIPMLVSVGSLDTAVPSRPQGDYRLRPCRVSVLR